MSHHCSKNTTRKIKERNKLNFDLLQWVKNNEFNVNILNSLVKKIRDTANKDSIEAVKQEKESKN